MDPLAIAQTLKTYHAGAFLPNKEAIALPDQWPKIGFQ
jgi:hypothetical protein